MEEISPKALKRLMDSGADFDILDVRERSEYDMCHIPGAKLIPLPELRVRLGELEKERQMVVYCHVGVRSGRAAELLLESGFKKVKNHTGGIRAWADEVDPTLPVY